MTKFLKAVLFCIVLILTNCTSGIQVSQKLNSLIFDKESKITTVVLHSPKPDGTVEQKAFDKEKIEIDNQFLKTGNEYINLEGVKSFKVNGEKIEIQF